MSVIANKRGLSSMQFYKTAMDLSRDITKLLHIGIDYRQGGEEVYSIRPHDVEDFKVIIEKYGVDWAERTVK